MPLHLAHGQRVRKQPRQLLAAVPGLTFREMPGADLCCGSAGIYNVVQNEMSMQILASKMEQVNTTGADVIATGCPYCRIMLDDAVRTRGKQDDVEVLDIAQLLARSLDHVNPISPLSSSET